MKQAEAERERLLVRGAAARRRDGRHPRLIADGLVVSDREGKILRFNPGFERLFGLPSCWRDLAVAERLRLLQMETPDGAPLRLEDSPGRTGPARRQRARRRACRARRPDGALVWLSVGATPSARARAWLGAVVTFADVTERRQAEERLRASEELLQGHRRPHSRPHPDPGSRPALRGGHQSSAGPVRSARWWGRTDHDLLERSEADQLFRHQAGRARVGPDGARPKCRSPGPAGGCSSSRAPTLPRLRRRRPGRRPHRLLPQHHRAAQGRGGLSGRPTPSWSARCWSAPGPGVREPHAAHYQRPATTRGARPRGAVAGPPSWCASSHGWAGTGMVWNRLARSATPARPWRPMASAGFDEGYHRARRASAGPRRSAAGPTGLLHPLGADARVQRLRGRCGDRALAPGGRCGAATAPSIALPLRDGGPGARRADHLRRPSRAPSDDTQVDC